MERDTIRDLVNKWNEVRLALELARQDKDWDKVSDFLVDLAEATEDARIQVWAKQIEAHQARGLLPRPKAG